MHTDKFTLTHRARLITVCAWSPNSMAPSGENPSNLALLGPLKLQQEKEAESTSSESHFERRSPPQPDSHNALLAALPVSLSSDLPRCVMLWKKMAADLQLFQQSVQNNTPSGCSSLSFWTMRQRRCLFKTSVRQTERRWVSQRQSGVVIELQGFVRKHEARIRAIQFHVS